MNENKTEIWKYYIKYLKKWADDYTNDAFYGNTPVCFDEWVNNEWLEENEEQKQKTYKIPVSWSMCAYEQIQANSLEEAVHIVRQSNNSDNVADKHLMDIEIAPESYYIDVVYNDAMTDKEVVEELLLSYDEEELIDNISEEDD